MYNGQTGRERRSPLFSDSGGGKWGVCVCLEYIKKSMMVKIGIKSKSILFYKGMIAIEKGQ